MYSIAIKIGKEERRLLKIYKAENDLISYNDTIRDLLTRVEAQNDFLPSIKD